MEKSGSSNWAVSLDPSTRLDCHQFTWKIMSSLETVLDSLAMDLAVSLLTLSPCLGTSTYTYCLPSQPINITTEAENASTLPAPASGEEGWSHDFSWPIRCSGWAFAPGLSDPGLFSFTTLITMFMSSFILFPQLNVRLHEAYIYAIFLVPKIIPGSQ